MICADFVIRATPVLIHAHNYKIMNIPDPLRDRAILLALFCKLSLNPEGLQG